MVTKSVFMIGIGCLLFLGLLGILALPASSSGATELFFSNPEQLPTQLQANGNDTINFTFIIRNARDERVVRHYRTQFISEAYTQTIEEHVLVLGPRTDISVTHSFGTDKPFGEGRIETIVEEDQAKVYFIFNEQGSVSTVNFERQGFLRTE